MERIKLYEGEIFEVSGNTARTYLYADGKITEITMQEFNIVNSVTAKERATTLFYFRLNNK